MPTSKLENYIYQNKNKSKTHQSIFQGIYNPQNKREREKKKGNSPGQLLYGFLHLILPSILIFFNLKISPWYRVAENNRWKSSLHLTKATSNFLSKKELKIYIYI